MKRSRNNYSSQKVTLNGNRSMPIEDQNDKNGSLGDLYEIEKINERVAQQIGKNAERTREIVTLEDESRQRFIDQDMPRSMMKIETDTMPKLFQPIHGGSQLGRTPPPLSQQLMEEQKVSEMRAFYERDLDNYFMV